MPDKNQSKSFVPLVAFFLATALFILPWHGAVKSQEEPPPEIDFTRIADYDIQVSLDPDSRTLTASETIKWVNSTGPETSEIKLHLYMNAFRGPDSPFFEHRGGWSEESAGNIEVSQLSLSDGTNLLSSATLDQTVMAATLPNPVALGEEVRLEIAFKVKLPKLIMRSGYSDDFYLIGQWFPKLGVYSNGTWICPQYSSFTEFYSDFGHYSVEITVPKSFEVAATGIRGRAHTDTETKTLYYSAYPVHDFAWMASPKYRRSKKTIEYSDSEGTQHSTEVHILTHRDRMDRVPAYEKTMARALAEMGKAYGPYPYKKIVVVDPDQGRGQFAAGMEYPMFITGGAAWLDTALNTGDKPIEMVTAHEFAHQYWHTTVANNEFEEPWLDEGLTTFTSNKVIDSFGLRAGNLNFLRILGTSYVQIHPFYWEFDNHYQRLSRLLELGLTTDTMVESRKNVLLYGEHNPVTTPAYLQATWAENSASAYNKPDLIFRTLERMIGERTVRNTLARVFSQYHFRHISGPDLRQLFSEVSGQNLDWFLNQVLDSSGRLDYCVETISDDYVLVKNLGDLDFPQEIKVWFDDNSTATFTWEAFSGREFIWMDKYETLPDDKSVNYMLRESKTGRWLKIYIDSTKKVVSAAVDPDLIYLLDYNYSNNSKSTSVQAKLADRVSLSWTRILARWFYGISMYN